MKRIRILLPAMLAMMTVSCMQEDLVPVDPPKDAIVIDLSSITYEGIAQLLSTHHEGLTDLEFRDGAYTKSLAALNLRDMREEENARTLVFRGAESDSLELILADDHVSIRLSAAGTRLAYLAYGDKAVQNRVAQQYSRLLATTRANPETLFTQSPAGTIRLNLTLLTQAMDGVATTRGTYTVEETEGTASQTRGLFSFFEEVKNLFTPPPPPTGNTPTINIYLMRERGSNPLKHEMNWQVNDAMTSLRDVESNIAFRVYIVDVEFRGDDNDSNATLHNFRDWVDSSSYKNAEGVFALCRWGKWDVLGRAFLNDYNVNTDRKAYMISATNAWNTYVMAHEMGHNFGAQHVEVKWYEIFGFGDLMGASSMDWMGTGKHNDANNRAIIKSNLTLNR